MSGPPDGPLIVCIHGLTVPSFVWGPLVKGLVALGFRVLVYDLYGRGFSDRPGGPQDKAFFNRQLDDLLAHLAIDSPFHLIGYSMGGAIAAGFAASHQARVQRVVLLAAAGMHLHTTARIRFQRERGLAGQWLFLATYPHLLRKGIRAERAALKVSREITEGQEAQLTSRGFIPAVLSSLRGLLSRPLEGEHLALKRDAIPILAIWGEEDDVIPAAAMGRLAAWNRDVQHDVIAGAGHGLPYTHTDAVLESIAAFLPPPQGDNGVKDP